MNDEQGQKLATEFAIKVERILKTYVKKLCLKRLTADELVENVMRVFSANILHFLHLATTDDVKFKKAIEIFKDMLTSSSLKVSKELKKKQDKND